MDKRGQPEPLFTLKIANLRIPHPRRMMARGHEG